MSTGKTGRGESIHNQSKSKLAKTISPALIKEVFDYWKHVMDKKRAVLDEKRTRDIGWAIAIWGIDGAKEAIDGCRASEFHMGNNSHKTTYNDVTLIFRDADHVEKFHELLDKSKKSSGKKKWLDS